jgi:molybdopterin converting factor small subunit
VSVTVLLPGPLREDAGGRSEVLVDHSGSLADVLDALARQLPLVDRRLRDETGVLRRHVNVFVDGEDVRFCGGLAAPVGPGSVVHLLPSVAGG